MATVKKDKAPFVPVTVTLTSLAELLAVTKAIGRTCPNDNCADAGLRFESDEGRALGKAVADLHFSLSRIAEDSVGRA